MSRTVKTLSNGQEFALTRREQEIIDLLAVKGNHLVGNWTGYGVYEYILYIRETVNTGRYQIVNSEMATWLNRHNIIESVDGKRAGNTFVLTKWGKKLVSKKKPEPAEKLDPTIRRIVHDQ